MDLPVQFSRHHGRAKQPQVIHQSDAFYKKNRDQGLKSKIYYNQTFKEEEKRLFEIATKRSVMKNYEQNAFQSF